MARGQSIRVFLADGTVTGIRHAEVFNWTGQALACPRSRVAELAVWDESQRPGVYLLFGVDENSGQPAVYIGEAENVLTRLQSHLVQKDFWTEIVIFSNKDENLTKAHVRYLEAKLAEMARAAARYKLTNANSPQPAALPRGDRDAMESFLDQVRLLLGVLGHRVLEPLASVPVIRLDSSATRELPEESAAVSTTVFHYSAKGVNASAIYSEEGLVVLEGSGAAGEEAATISPGYRRLRSELRDAAVLVPAGENLVFTKSFLFTSPSAAAVVVAGYPVNGREAWKTDLGETFAEVESATVSAPTVTAGSE